MRYIGNAFSLQMLENPECKLIIHELELEEFDAIKTGAYSCVGHKDLANILGVEYNRETISLKRGDCLLVAQLWGGRLPEGATSLPEDMVLRFFIVQITSEFVEVEQ